MDADLVIIGGGAAGLASARAGRRLGATVLVVSAGPIGGECTFRGCVPSKTLIEAAAKSMAFPEVMNLVAGVVAAVAATENEVVLEHEGIAVLRGFASFRSDGEINVDGRAVRAERFVVATGGQPVIPTVPGLTGEHMLSTDDIFELAVLPPSLLVLGGGSAGCELGQAFARLGSRVTIVETADRLLGRDEPDASRVITDVFRREGIDVRTGTHVVRADEVGRGLRAQLDDGTVVLADRVLCAVGRRPALEGLDPSAAGLAVRDGRLVVDEHLATTSKRIWAAGDVVGTVQFAHAADLMGRIAARNALGHRWQRRRFNPHGIPAVTFTSPEVARVGMSETEAAEVGGRVVTIPMNHVDRAKAACAEDGFATLIVGPRRLLRNVGGGKVLGASIVAQRAGEMIHEPTLAIRTGMFAGRLAQTTHAYPTWSTAIQQATAQLFVDTGDRPRPAQRSI